MKGLDLKEKGRERFDPEKRRRSSTKDERKSSSTSGSRTTDKHSKGSSSQSIPSSTSKASSAKTAKGSKLKSTIGSYGDNITSRVTRGDLKKAASGKKPLKEVGREVRSFLENSIAKGSKIKLNETKKVDWYSRKQTILQNASLKNEDLKSRCKEVCILNFQPDLLHYSSTCYSSLALKYIQYCLVNQTSNLTCRKFPCNEYLGCKCAPLSGT